MGKGGEGVGVAAQPDILADPFLAQFAGPGCDVPAFANRSLSGTAEAAQATAWQLSEGVRALDQHIRQEVLARQEELLGQVRGVHEAEALTQGVTAAVEALQGLVGAARAQVAGPYEALRAQTAQLHALHAVVDLLRHLLHHLKLVAKLKAAMTATGGKLTPLDLAKAARLLVEVREGEAECPQGLGGLQAAAQHRAFLGEAARQLHEQAEAALAEGMEALSQAGVGSALQVFYNLEELQQAVTRVVEGAAARFERALTAALRTAPTPTKGGGTSAELAWQRLGQAMDSMHSGGVAAWHLQRVLAKKRDPLSHTLFSAALAAQGAPLPLTLLWGKVSGALAAGMAGAARGEELRGALTAGFPRLAALLDAALARMLRDTEVKGVAPVVTPEDTAALVGALDPLRDAFLGEVLRHLSAGVAAAFPGGTRPLPSPAELQKCIARMHEEVKAVSSSPRLAARTAACVGTALRQLVERAEYMAATGPEVRAVGSACTPAQARNIALCCQLGEVHRSMAVLQPRLPPEAAAALEGPLGALEAAATDAVLPIFRAAAEGAEGALLSMHSVDYGTAAAPQVAQASPYLARLASHLAHIRMEYLSKFTPAVGAGAAAGGSSFGAALTQRLACRVCVFAVRHAALLRPLSPAGKVQLAKDLAELEPLLGQYLLPLETLAGSGPRQPRALRSLLFAPTPGLDQQAALMGCLPRPVILHHLFSRGPASLPSPHTRSGFTPSQYSLWLDEHSSGEALKYIATAVRAGRADLARSGELPAAGAPPAADGEPSAAGAPPAASGEAGEGTDAEELPALLDLMERLCAP